MAKIDLGNMRRYADPDLQDRVFGEGAAPGGTEDWRAHVPERVREVWPEMSQSERIGVVVMARCLAGSC